MWLLAPRRIIGSKVLRFLWCYSIPALNSWIQYHVDLEAWLLINSKRAFPETSNFFFLFFLLLSPLLFFFFLFLLFSFFKIIYKLIISFSLFQMRREHGSSFFFSKHLSTLNSLSQNWSVSNCKVLRFGFTELQSMQE